MARLLREDGHEVDVLAAADLGELRGDALANLERLPGAPPEPFAAERLDGSGAVVDALLGTGFEGAPREPLASAIAAINAQDAPVVACDVPSGVDASTGEVEGEAVRAVATATFHGLEGRPATSHPGKAHAGRVEVVEIGIPRGAPGAERAGLITERVLDLFPRRGAGRLEVHLRACVVVAGGSLGLTGAPTMAARSAQRAGAGYVQVAVPGPVQPVDRPAPARADEPRAARRRRLPHAGRGRGRRGDGASAPAPWCSARASAAPRAPRTSPAGSRVAVETPLLIDADGLNAHAGRLELLRERSAPTVLTPHEGELGRLLERPSSEVAAHRLARGARGRRAQRRGRRCSRATTRSSRCPGGEVAVSPGGTPALATAGTGDVLSGLIGALLAKGLGAVRGGLPRRARPRPAPGAPRPSAWAPTT